MDYPQAARKPSGPASGIITPMEGNKNVFTIIGIVMLIAGLAAGYFIGDARGAATTESALLPLIETVIPRPPEVMNSLSGTVSGTYGASFSIAVVDPDDYLPRLDGSPKSLESRTVNVSAGTEYALIDYTSIDREGNPRRTPLTLSDLRVGEVVTVWSNENIRDAGSFEASVVQKVIY